MSDKTGLGLLEVAVLEALSACGARPDRPYVKSATIIAALERTTGIGPDYGYRVLCDLAAPWLLQMPLVDGHGNFGSPDFEPSAPRYNEARLSRVGAMALEAEHADGPSIPVDMVNGNVHIGGQRPPFNPVRLATTLLRLIDGDDLTDAQIVDEVGPPEFPTRCGVEGDLSGLVRGEPTTLQLVARLSPSEVESSRDGLRPAIMVGHLPPGIGPTQLGRLLTARARTAEWEPDEPELAREARLPIAEVLDLSRGSWANTSIHVIPSDAVPLDSLAAKLKKVWGIAIELRVQLSAPLASILRSWVEQHRDEDDLHTGITRLIGRGDR